MAAVNEVEPVTIREARLDDVADLARLSGDLGYPAENEQLLCRLKSIVNDMDHAVFVAQDSLGGLTGWVHVYVYKVLEVDHRAEIGGLVTDPTMRRRGIGRALMFHVERWARERNLSLISLRSNVSRNEAHLFYEGIGYAKVKTQLNFRKKI